MTDCVVATAPDVHSPKPLQEEVPRDLFNRIIAKDDFLICPDGAQSLRIAKVRAVEKRGVDGGPWYFVMTLSVCESKPMARELYPPMYWEAYAPQQYIRVPRIVIPKEVLELLDKAVDRKGVH